MGRHALLQQLLLLTYWLLVLGGRPTYASTAGLALVNSPSPTHYSNYDATPPLRYYGTACCFTATYRCNQRRRRRSSAVHHESIISAPLLLSATKQHLFFRAREEESLKKRRKAAYNKIPKWALDALRQKDRSLPFQFPLVEGTTDEKAKASLLESSERTYDKQMVTIRLLTVDDLTTIVPMCVSEFGGGETSLQDLIDNFPWQEPRKAKQYLSDWWDNFALPSFVHWTFRFKIATRDPQDHALLVATLHNGVTDNSSIQDASTTATTNCDNGKTVLVGMVEISKQPPEARRNPSAFPLPLWYKELYCRLKNLPPPDGWVTNLLVGPDFRGQGYSKLLMASAEGVARCWGCKAIHLHCDADTVSGKVPQQLYRGLGYEMVEDKNSPFSWMGSEFSNKIFMVEGVPLLYFRKSLA